MKRIAAALAVVLALAVAACASAPIDGPSGTDPGPTAIVTDQIGSISMRLTLAGGIPLNAVQWTIHGGGSSAFTRTGSVNLENSPALTFTVGDLPVGSAQISISGSTPGGGVTCAGSASFNVAQRQTSQVPVLLACTTAPIANAPATPPGAAALLAFVLAGMGVFLAGRRRAGWTGSTG